MKAGLTEHPYRQLLHKTNDEFKGTGALILEDESEETFQVLVRWYNTAREALFWYFLIIARDVYTAPLFVYLQWLIMSLQFISYAFYPLLDFPWEANLVRVLRAITVNVSRFPATENGLGSESVYFAIAFFGLFVCVNVLAAFSATLLKWDWPVRLARIMLKVYRTILFVPIMRAFMQTIFGCMRDEGLSGDHPFLHGIACWDNTHIILTALSCVFAVVFMAFILLAAGCIYDTDGNPRSRVASLDSKSDGWGSIYFHFAHFIFLIFFAALHNHGSRYYLAILLAVSGVILAAHQVYVLPYYDDIYQAAVVFMYLLLFWTGVGSFAATLLEYTSGTAVILFCGFPVLLIASILAVRSRYSYVESLRDSDLTSPLLFELRARIISQGMREQWGLYFDDTEETEERLKRIRFDCEHLLQLGIDRFPNDPRLHLVFTTFFIYIIDNKVLAYSELQAVEACEPQWDVHFFVQHYRHLLDLATIAAQSREVQSYLEFKNRKEVADDCVRTGAKSIFEFWSELLRSAPDINTLSLLGHMSRTAMNKASFNYDKLLEINPNSVPVLRSYGVFVLDLMGDVPRASVLFKRAEDVEKQRKKTLNLNMQRGNFLQHMENNLDIFDERNAVFGVIVDRRRVGIIESVNSAGRRLLGYPQLSDMIGQNISLIIPRPLSDVHDELLINFLNLGASRILNTTRVAFALHKSGHIFPINLYIRWADQGNGKMVGVIQPIDVKRDVHLIIDRETNIIQYATVSCFEHFGVSKDQVANRLLKLWDLLPMLNDKDDIDTTDRCWEQIVMRSGLTCIGYHHGSGEHFGVQAWLLDVVVGGRDITFVKIHVFTSDTDSDEEEGNYMFGGDYDSDDDGNDDGDDNESLSSSVSGGSSYTSSSLYSNSLTNSRSSVSSTNSVTQANMLLQQQQLLEEDTEDEFTDAHMHIYGRKPGQPFGMHDGFDVMPPLREEGEDDASVSDEDSDDSDHNGSEIVRDANGRSIMWADPNYAAADFQHEETTSIGRSSSVSDGKRSLTAVLEDLKKKKRRHRRRKRMLGLETESVTTEGTGTISNTIDTVDKQAAQYLDLTSTLLNKRGYKKLMRVISQENVHTSRWLQRLSRFFLLLMLGVCVLAITLYTVITGYLYYSHDQLHRVVAGMERGAIIQDSINHIRATTMLTAASVPYFARPAAFPVADITAIREGIIARIRQSNARFRELATTVSETTPSAVLHALHTQDVIPMHVMIGGEITFDFMGLLDALESFVAMSFEAVTTDPSIMNINDNHAAYFTIANGLKQLPEMLDLASEYLRDMLADNNYTAMWISIALIIIAALLIIFVFMFLVRPIVMHIERGKARVLVMFMNIPKNVRRMLRRRAYLAMKDDAESNESEPDIVFADDDEKSMTSTLRDTTSNANSRPSTTLQEQMDVTQRYNLYTNDKIKQHLQENGTALAKEIDALAKKTAAKKSKVVDDMIPSAKLSRHEEEDEEEEDSQHVDSKTIDQHVSRHNIVVLFSKYVFFFFFVMLYFSIVVYYTTVRMDDVTKNAKLAHYASLRSIHLQRAYFATREHMFMKYADVASNYANNPTVILGPFRDMGLVSTELSRMLESSVIYGNRTLGISSSPYYPAYAATLYGDACALPFDPTIAPPYFKEACPSYYDGLLTSGAHYVYRTSIDTMESLMQPAFEGMFAHLLGGPAHPLFQPGSLVYETAMTQLTSLDTLIHDLASYALRLAPYALSKQSDEYIASFDTFRIVFLLCFLAGLLVLYLLVYHPIVQYLNVSARQTRAMMLVLPPDVVQVCASVQQFIVDHLSD